MLKSIFEAVFVYILADNEVYIDRAGAVDNAVD